MLPVEVSVKSTVSPTLIVAAESVKPAVGRAGVVDDALGVRVGFGLGLIVGLTVGLTDGLTEGGAIEGDGDGDGDGVGPIVITGIGVGVASTPRLGFRIGPKVAPGGRLTGGGSEPIATVLGSGVAEPAGPAVCWGMNTWPASSASTTTIRIVAESRQSWRRRSSSARPRSPVLGVTTRDVGVSPTPSLVRSLRRSSLSGSWASLSGS